MNATATRMTTLPLQAPSMTTSALLEP